MVKSDNKCASKMGKKRGFYTRVGKKSGFYKKREKIADFTKKCLELANFAKKEGKKVREIIPKRVHEGE